MYTPQNTLFNLYWKGDINSTFRLFHLLVILKVDVKPHYILQPDNRFLGNELHSLGSLQVKIQAIIDSLRSKNVKAGLFLPLTYVNCADILLDEKIKLASNSLNSGPELNDELSIIAAYARQSEIGKIQFCVTKEHMPSKLASFLHSPTSNELSAQEKYDFDILSRYISTDLHEITIEEIYEFMQSYNLQSILEHTSDASLSTCSYFENDSRDKTHKTDQVIRSSETA